MVVMSGVWLTDYLGLGLIRFFKNKAKEYTESKQTNMLVLVGLVAFCFPQDLIEKQQRTPLTDREWAAPIGRLRFWEIWKYILINPATLLIC